MRRTLLFILFTLGFVFHFYRFWEWGTSGDDQIMYQKIALEWLNSNFLLTYPEGRIQFFRPVLYCMMALSFAVFGVNLWALKLMNLIIVTSVVIIMWSAGKRLKLNSNFVPLTPLLILYHPMIIDQSRRELAHLPSLFFISFSLYFFIVFSEYNKIIYLALAGIFLQLAAGTHADLALLLPGFLLVLILQDFKLTCSHWQFNRKFILHASVFAISFCLPIIIYSLEWSFLEIAHIINRIRTFDVPVDDHYPFKLLIQFLTIGVVQLIGLPFTCVFYGSVFFRMLVPASGQRHRSRLLLMVVPVIVYFILFDLLVTRNNFYRLSRLLVPLLPFLGLYLTLELQELTRRAPKVKFLIVLLFFLFPVKFLHAINHNPSWDGTIFNILNRYLDQSAFRYKSQDQMMFELLQDKVNDEHKLLLAPSHYAKNRRAWALSLPFYFGHNIVYLDKCLSKDTDLETFIKVNSISYVLIYPRIHSQDPGASLRVKPPRKKDEVICLMREDDNYMYDVETENEILRSRLENFGARQIPGPWGELYEFDTAINVSH